MLTKTNKAGVIYIINIIMASTGHARGGGERQRERGSAHYEQLLLQEFIEILSDSLSISLSVRL